MLFAARTMGSGMATYFPVIRGTRRSPPVWWSPRVRNVGVHRREFPDILDSWISRLHPDDREGVFQRLNACMEQGVSHYDVEYRLLNKQQEYQWFHARAEVVQRDAQGRAIRMAGALQDITDRKQTEASLFLSAKNGYAWRSPPRISAFGIGMSLEPSLLVGWRRGAVRTVPGSFAGTYPCVYRPDLLIGSRFHSDPHRTQPARPHVHHHPASRGVA